MRDEHGLNRLRINSHIRTRPEYPVIRAFYQLYTLLVESFACRKFHGDKLLRTPRAKIKFRGYKLSRLQGILVKFSYFNAIFGVFLSNISRTFIKVRFRGYKLSRSTKKIAKSRNFLPAKLSTFKVFLSVSIRSWQRPVLYLLLKFHCMHLFQFRFILFLNFFSSLLSLLCCH